MVSYLQIGIISQKFVAYCMHAVWINIKGDNKTILVCHGIDIYCMSIMFPQDHVKVCDVLGKYLRAIFKNKNYPYSVFILGRIR